MCTIVFLSSEINTKFLTRLVRHTERRVATLSCAIGSQEDQMTCQIWLFNVLCNGLPLNKFGTSAGLALFRSGNSCYIVCFLCQVLIYGGLELIPLLLKRVIESNAKHHWERQKCSEIPANLTQLGNQRWDSVSPSHCGTCWNRFKPLNFPPTGPSCLLLLFHSFLEKCYDAPTANKSDPIHPHLMNPEWMDKVKVKHTWVRYSRAHTHSGSVTW